VLCAERNADELKRIFLSNDPVDEALQFLYRLTSGSAFENDVLRRNSELGKALDTWMAKARRILERDKRAEQKKLDQKQAAREKLKALGKR